MRFRTGDVVVINRDGWARWIHFYTSHDDDDLTQHPRVNRDAGDVLLIIDVIR